MVARTCCSACRASSRDLSIQDRWTTRVPATARDSRRPAGNLPFSFSSLSLSLAESIKMITRFYAPCPPRLAALAVPRMNYDEIPRGKGSCPRAVPLGGIITRADRNFSRGTRDFRSSSAFDRVPARQFIGENTVSTLPRRIYSWFYRARDRLPNEKLES